MDELTLVNTFWTYMTQRNFHKLDTLFCKEATIIWPNTTEIFTVDQFIAVNINYPGNWTEAILDIYQTTKEVITITLIDDENVSFHTVSIFTCKDGQIQQLKEYYADDGTPPQWRLDFMKHYMQS